MNGQFGKQPNPNQNTYGAGQFGKKSNIPNGALPKKEIVETIPDTESEEGVTVEEIESIEEVMNAPEEPKE